MRKLLLGFLFLTVSLSAFTGCTSGKDDSSPESKLEKATASIDKGEYDQAIESLIELRKTDSSPEVAMVLASAYAGRAGIKVEDYWGFVVGYEALLNPAEPAVEENAVIKDLKSFAAKASPETTEFINTVTEKLQELMKWKKRIDQIPVVSKDKFHDLQEGVKVLGKVETRGAHLYRAVLELVLLRSVIEDTAVKINTWAAKPTGPCATSAKPLIQWLDFSHKTLLNVLVDLGKAYPDDEVDFAAVRSTVNSFAIPSTEQLCGSGS